MRVVEVFVTQAIIDDAIERVWNKGMRPSYNCPIALALTKAIGEPMSGSNNTFRPLRGKEYPDKALDPVYIPDEGVEVVHAFDRHDAACPTHFTVTVPW